MHIKIAYKHKIYLQSLDNPIKMPCKRGTVENDAWISIIAIIISIAFIFIILLQSLVTVTFRFSPSRGLLEST